MENNYRILKLKNGESIIAGLSSLTNKNTLILERPMQFRTMTMIDDKTLSTKDLLLIRNWAEYSEDKNVEIPNDTVLAILKPDDKIVSVYDFEKNKIDNPPAPQTLVPFTMNQQDAENFSNMIENNDLQKLNIQLELPPDASQQFLEMLGIEFGEEDLDDMDDLDDEDDDLDDGDDFPAPPKPKADSKKQSKKPMWGNSLEDWSPDPYDYLK
jgi:hypothetical protein